MSNSKKYAAIRSVVAAGICIPWLWINVWAAAGFTGGERGSMEAFFDGLIAGSMDAHHIPGAVVVGGKPSATNR